MEILVCVKRVPAPGAKIVLTDDGSAIQTKHLGFTVSPHEECAVEEAVQLVERHGGRSTVLTLGPPAAEEQLRDAVAMGVDEGVLLEADSTEWEPRATAGAIVDAVRTLQDEGRSFDLLLFGNESADAGYQQVGIRVAHALDLPVVSGIKGLEVSDGHVSLRRDTPGGFERYEVALPAVAAVKEGLNLPRYPALKGRMRARKAAMRRISVAGEASGLQMLGLRHPPGEDAETAVLGRGAQAAPAVLEVLREQGVV